MSCQQASRFIASNSNNSKNNINNNNCKQNINNNNIINIGSHCAVKGNRLSRSVVQQEDPYVFTESVPTTPPILFNTQKTRTRLSDLTSTNAALSIGKLQQHKQQKLPLTETNGKITTNILKTQASLSSLSSSSPISSSSSLSLTTTITNSTNTKTFNTSGGVTQSLTITTAANNGNSKKLTNVCIVRPQLQQQHQQQQQHYINEEDLKSVSPPPLYTPPTASLWQTPLLLESTTASTTTTTTTTTTLYTNASTPQITNVARQQASNPSLIMGCVSPTVVQTIGNTTSIMNPSLNTTAMAKVAPIVVNTPPLAPPPPPLPKQCLPPSKFHNHTLAQHLQKVECLKQSKKFGQTGKLSACNGNIKSDTPSSPTKAATLKTLDSSAASQTLKHSEKEDLNEIPVNVIFRMVAVTQQQQENEKYDQNTPFVRPAAIEQLTAKGQQQVQEISIPIPPPPPPSLSASLLSPPSLQPKTTANVNRKLSLPASKTNTTNQLVKKQIHTSSIHQQHQQQPQNNAKTKITALNYDESKPANAKTSILSLKNTDNETTSTTTSIAVTKTNLKSKTSTHISNKIQKSNFVPSCTSSSNLTLNLPYNSWQMGCSTTKGAVAIVKMSQHNIDLDTTQLATATGLPYCIQHYWLDTNSSEYRKSSKILVEASINRSLAREERIALYKQQLRRQAMQLLSTRSLQRLPIQIARRRLLCVDRLLRKYQHNEQTMKEQPANVKRCCVNGCDGHTLEMASHCQQHIVYNSAQHVFLPCTAKFADNTQCRIPVFDIAHDLPLCIEHARKRDAYNRLLYEQRPRKISTNTAALRNDSITATSTSSTTSKITSSEGAGVVVGVIMKNQQQQQLQQQKQSHKHVQQIPLNNHSNGNKGPALANQQQQTRKRKMTNGINVAAAESGNTVGRPQKRVRKTLEKSAVSTTTTTTTKPTTILLNTVGNPMTNQQQQLPRLTSTSLKRKSSTTSLESIASNSQHSTISVTSQQPPLYSVNSSHVTTTATSITTTSTTPLPPPALAPLSSSGGFGLVGHGLPQHLFSYGHDNKTQHINQQPQLLHTLNLNDKHSFSSSNTPISTATASTPTELKDFISQFALVSQQKHSQNNNEQSIMSSLSTCDVNLLNTNSNSNFTSSGMGSTTSLPTADDFLTQDMLSICENSSASSADTGLGGLSDPELMLGGPDDDIPLGDTHLLEEHDLETVLNSLPEDAFKELFTTVHQDESDEIERAIELADKHLKTLQQTIGSELGDYLDFADDMLMDNDGDLCNESSVTANSILDTTALFIGGGAMGGQITATASAAQGGVASAMGTEIRGGLVQT